MCLNTAAQILMLGTAASPECLLLTLLTVTACSFSVTRCNGCRAGRYVHLSSRGGEKMLREVEIHSGD